MKVFNVWLIVEEIDEAKDDNGKDITHAKFCQCKTEEQADGYVNEILEYQEEIKATMGDE